jgi:hypothetical protein
LRLQFEIMNLNERPPSSGWEPVPFADEPNVCVWVWFKPPSAPNAVVVRIPDETFRDAARRQPLTMRRVLAAVGVDPRWVAVWSLYGVPYDAQQGANPVLDFVIPEPSVGVDPTISIFVGPPPVAAAQPAVEPSAPHSAALADVFAHMEVEWNSSVQLEGQLDAAAKQLNATLLRINSLNRDLSSEEARSADQLDKHEWQEARRMLRDVAARLARLLKDHHLGVTSFAGKRDSYVAIYQQYVAPRRPFSGIEQMEREFESYRKSMQTLLNNMNVAQGAAIQDGERRAQQVLTRIAGKVRASRAKR